MREMIPTLLVLYPLMLTAAEFTLENADVRLSVDQRGYLTALVNRHTKHNYAAGRPLWRAFYRRGDMFEVDVLPEESHPVVKREGEALVVRYQRLASRRGPINADLELTARLAGDEVRWTARMSNHQPEIVISELQFPLVGACNFKPDQALILSAAGGQRFDNPRQQIHRSHTLYMSPDQTGIRMMAMYPGTGAATNSYVFAGPDEGLYFGSHDPTFQQTVHLFRMQGTDVETGFVKYPFLTAGKSVTEEGYVISPYRGDWHTAAKKYRAWADTWFHPVKKPAWIENMAGWQRVILKHQYGEVLHPYHEVPQIYKDGAAAGIPTLLAFGWHDAGMDAGYPNYVADERQGGRAALVEAIRQVHRQGGRVHLYFNGRLIDKQSAFYKNGGSRVTIKDWRGNEVVDSYHFSGNGTAVRQFGRVSLVIACPAAREWREMMKRWADDAIAMGADTVFYDQMGVQEYPCTDPRHGHPVPFTGIPAAKADLLREIREHIKARGAELGLGTEVLNDGVSRFGDFIHNVTGSAAAGNDWQKGQKPKLTGFVEWFRYIFPEIIVSDREIRDDTDVERRVNHAVMLGLRSDVEIYRCRGTIRDTPKYAAWIAKANALRSKYAALLLSGIYSDTEFFRSSNPEIEGRSFRAGNRLAVVLAQSHLERAATQVAVPGYRFVEHGGMGGYSVQGSAGGARVDLPRHALAVVIFERQ